MNLNFQSCCGRVLGVVIVGEKNVNQELLKAGLAWHFKRYNQDAELAALEDEGRAAGVGLWADPESGAPWEWRKQRREATFGG